MCIVSFVQAKFRKKDIERKKKLQEEERKKQAELEANPTVLTKKKPKKKSQAAKWVQCVCVCACVYVCACVFCCFHNSECLTSCFEMPNVCLLCVSMVITIKGSWLARHGFETQKGFWVSSTPSLLHLLSLSLSLSPVLQSDERWE